jgi:hypothetical protein
MLVRPAQVGRAALTYEVKNQIGSALEYWERCSNLEPSDQEFKDALKSTQERKRINDTVKPIFRNDGSVSAPEGYSILLSGFGASVGPWSRPVKKEEYQSWLDTGYQFELIKNASNESMSAVSPSKPSAQSPQAKPKNLALSKIPEDATSTLQKQAELAVALARERFKCTLDYSERSLDNLESLFEQAYNHFNQLEKTGKLRIESVQYTANVWGSYLGEMLRRKWGGKWLKKDGETVLALDKMEISPIKYVYQHILRQPEYNVKKYWAEIKAATGR